MRTTSFFLSAVLLLAATSLLSQDTINFQMPTSINLDGSPPDGSAILDVQSTDKGMLVPRMTSAQRMAIDPAATGLLVFDVTTDSFWYFDGTAWVDLSGTPGGILDADGDTGIRAEFTPDEDRLRFRANGFNAMVIDTSGKVGIGVPVPEVRLDVAGTVRTDGLTLPTGASLGHVLKSDAAGQSAWQPLFPTGFIPEPTPFVTSSFGLGTGPYTVAVRGDYAYVVDINDDNLIIIDISDPDNLSLVSNVTFGPGMTEIVVQGNFAYITDVSLGELLIINVSDPANPSLSGSLSLGADPRYLAVKGDYAYVTDNIDDNLRIVDVSNPTNPVLVSTLSLGSYAWEIVVQGDYAYVVDIQDDDLKIIDVSNPANPTISGSISTGSWPNSLAIKDNYVYVLATTFDMLEVIDVSDPTNPTLSSSINMPPGVSFLNLRGNYIFMIDYLTFELRTLDISNPTAPTFSTSLLIGGSPEELDVQGSFAYVTDNASDEIKAIKLSGTTVVGLDLNGDLVASPLTWATTGNDLRNTNNGNVGIGRKAITNKLEVNGDASKSTAGDWLANSDARLKKNIRPLDSEAILQKMLALQGITYEWDDDQTGSERPTGTMYGFTAQNIQEVFPELVTEDNLGFLQTAYGTYDAMTVEAMRALKMENEELRMENAALAERLSAAEASLARLEAAVFGEAEKPAQAGEED